MRENLTEIIIILDRSGSMQSIQSDMEGALGNFIDEQAEVEGEVNLTFVRFDDQYEEVFTGKPIKDVSCIKLVPRGTTALLDAVGKTINSVGERLSKMPEHDRPSKVVVCIVTDGQENSSTEFTNNDIQKMIKEYQEKCSWVFTYLGADHDSFDVASRIGIPRDCTMNYCKSASGAGNAMKSMSVNVALYRTSGQSIRYSDKDRSDSMQE
jgi:uncharacterized protein YegL